MGKAEAKRFFKSSFVCLKGYFGAKKEAVKGNAWGLYASLRKQQRFQVRERE